jgi:endonuclease YncB( thermonuclease family)
MLCILVCGGWVQAQAADVVGTVRVIDGDTFDVGGTRVRLHGIDAPERDQPCTSSQGEVWSCGQWVSDEVRARYQNAQAQCIPVTSDRYGRTVAKCFVNGTDVGRSLVQEGLAFAYRKYALDYDLDEKGAAIRNLCLHASTVEAPAAFRAARGAERAQPLNGCVIKGNISSKGTRIYHSPDQRDYENTRISPNKGERWFCSASEAEAAGWRAARR